MIRPNLALVLRAVGAAGAMALMMWLSDWRRQPLDGIPFATSIVLATYLPPGPWQVPAAIAASVLLMLATRTMHPPAGINALLPVTHDFGWSFLLNPVLVGALLLVAYAILFSRLAGWAQRDRLHLSA